MKTITLPSYLKGVRFETAIQKSDKKEDIEFAEVIDRLQSIKNKTRCSECKRTLSEMLDLGSNYQRVQHIINKMEAKGVKNWNELSESEKAELKKQ